MTPPSDRLSLLFSATLSHRVAELAYEHMNEPAEVKIESEQVTADKVTQIVYHPSNQEKMPLLVGLLKREETGRTLVFVNTKWIAEKIYNTLIANDFKAGIISGDVPQKKRERLLQAFKDDEIDILVATDVAARGLHIPEVSHVFNYDLPQDAEDYVHRIGRTARAGASGDAISFACEDTAYYLVDIEEYIGMSVPAGMIEPDMLAELKPVRRGKGKARSGAASGKERKSRRDDNAPRGKKHAGKPESDTVKTGKARQRTEHDEKAGDKTEKKHVRQEDMIQVETPLSPSAKESPAVRRGRDGPPAIG
jgi:ATP-dependent RNA helicase RhlB